MNWGIPVYLDFWIDETTQDLKAYSGTLATSSSTRKQNLNFQEVWNMESLPYREVSRLRVYTPII